jgi:UDP-N-acetylglucosamine diphosphorylase / glucose-1-phosphate thymidylyltransferase / UDP-N-acetylgalactosamine diphosphorylase / glucosamine-1-phosphate N-acetyltransferase / galactosamine-1-phosphate N-acetyltransferase
MQAVILAAGKGLRLRPFTEHHPKPLIPIADKALIEYTLETLPDQITEIIIVVGYLAEQIKDHLGDSWNGKPIKYVVQEKLQGTGDALLQAKDVVEQNFLVVNGDDLYAKKDLTALLQYPMSILAWQSSVPYQFGLKVDDNHKLLGFDPKSTLMNCGAYHLTKEFFNTPLAEITVRDKTEYSLPHTLVGIAEHEDVFVVPATHWFPVGTPAQLDFANGYYVNKIQE